MPSANQLAQQDKFRLAVLHGKAVLADPEPKQVYQDAADRKGIPAFALTVADFLNPPALTEIDLSAYTGKTGDKIAVHASDDVEVKGVTVSIRAQAGAVLAPVSPPSARDLTLDPCSYAYSTPAPSEPEFEIRNLRSKTQIPKSPVGGVRVRARSRVRVAALPNFQLPNS